MKIDGFQIPADILKHYREAVKAAEADTILWYAKADPAVAHGLRIKASSVPGLRTSILRKLNKDSSIEDPMRALLVMASPITPAITSLATSAITVLWDALQVVYGTPFIAGALLDSRETIHKLAVDALGDQVDKDGLPTLEEACSTVAEFIEDINAPLAPSLSEFRKTSGHTQAADAASGESVDAADLVTLREKITKLKLQLHEDGTRAQQVKSLQKKLDQAEKRSADAAANAAKAQKATREAEGAARKLQTELEKIRSDNEKRDLQTDKRIAQRVNERLESVLNSWVVPLQELAKEAATCTDDLLSRAKQVVSKQSRIDKHAGNRLQIREQIAALRDALTAVRQAAAGAILPIPELATTEADLEKEIARLESAIGRLSPDVAPFETRVAGRIERAANLEDLQSSRLMLEQLATFGIFEEAELVRLYQAYNRRMSVIYSQFGPRIVKAAKWDDPVWRLKHAAASDDKIQLLVDGYNALHLAKDLFADDFEDDVPRAQARDHLMGLLQRMFYSHPECDVRVYWDSSEHAERRRGANLREIYSGGEGDHRADKLIIHDLHRATATDADIPRMLVTDDRDLRAQAKRIGAQVMSVVQFSALLEDLR